MSKPNFIDRYGNEWVPYGDLYKKKNDFHSSGVYTRADIDRYYGPFKEEKPRKEEKATKATVVKTFILCPECGEDYDVSVTLSRVEDHVWEPRLVRHEGEKGQRAHRCEVPPMDEPEVGTIVNVDGKYFVRAIREGKHSSHDWIDLERQSHTSWQNIVSLGMPALGYYNNTLEY